MKLLILSLLCAVCVFAQPQRVAVIKANAALVEKSTAAVQSVRETDQRLKDWVETIARCGAEVRAILDAGTADTWKRDLEVIRASVGKASGAIRLSTGGAALHDVELLLEETHAPREVRPAVFAATSAFILLRFEVGGQ